MIPKGRRASDDLISLRDAIRKALRENKPADIAGLERFKEKTEAEAREFIDALAGAKAHTATYTKNEYKKVVKKIFQSKVMQNRKDLEGTIRLAQGTSNNINEGLKAADELMEELKARKGAVQGAAPRRT
jgi:hypothetical protein